ncbi:hypothetical protein IJH33_00285 [Candidatus Saccharibacteria bacterium]|nr:hypothetical protein [Candidatus Saccharibacteria bacterium]
MKKRWLVATAVLMVQFLVVNGGTRAEEAELSEERRSAIVDHCETIRGDLRNLQRMDSRTRVYLGRYYETILTKFVTPLNLRLVENNLSDVKLIENQTNLVTKRSDFVDDFTKYSQTLEELIGIDCKAEPERFYERLVVTRERRAKLNRDAEKMRDLTGEQVTLVKELRDRL